jgi:NADPH:quinone reductase-like Zn-dependent oxidoreductase
MKAIRVQHTGGPEVMELAEVPTPQPKPNEVLVKVSVAGVNSIDAQFRDVGRSSDKDVESGGSGGLERNFGIVRRIRRRC